MENTVISRSRVRYPKVSKRVSGTGAFVAISFGLGLRSSFCPWLHAALFLRAAGGRRRRISDRPSWPPSACFSLYIGPSGHLRAVCSFQLTFASLWGCTRWRWAGFGFLTYTPTESCLESFACPARARDMAICVTCCFPLVCWLLSCVVLVLRRGRASGLNLSGILEDLPWL